MTPVIFPETQKSPRSLTDNDRLGAAGFVPVINAGAGQKVRMSDLK